MPHPFTGSFTQQDPLPHASLEAAMAVLRTARLHRYNAAEGEEPEAAALEREFAAWQGARYCLATASGGQALQLALRAAGVAPGDRVLTNAFTLAPVPGAIRAVGAEAVLVEITENLVIDLDDLAARATATGAKVLMLSLMRGHLPDMDALMERAGALGLTVIEDCAHTMGARWAGRRSGSFGVAGCFSTQTYKHMNSGEGGFLTSDDPDLMARAIVMSGSYMLYARHGAAPDEAHFRACRLDVPNISARMDNLRAAILRPQLPGLEARVARWNALHDPLAARLAAHPAVRLPSRPQAEAYVGSSLQFRLPGASAAECEAVVERARAGGVELKWFGAAQPVAFTSTHRSWRYLPTQALPQTDRVLATLFDLRLPLTFTPDDIGCIADNILAALPSGAQAAAR
jgi:dTDP-4-amino-4,6-dideoxygalactose transaminase